MKLTLREKQEAQNAKGSEPASHRVFEQICSHGAAQASQQFTIIQGRYGILPPVPTRRVRQGAASHGGSRRRDG